MEEIIKRLESVKRGMSDASLYAYMHLEESEETEEVRNLINHYKMLLDGVIKDLKSE